MSFLAPLALLSGLLGGAIVLMYLLKLKRKPEEFSSTLLWMKSMEDLTANAPFQKLRQNLLMYLQILLLLLVAFSLARPTMWLSRRSGISRIVLIDNSASMNATDVDDADTRLDAAKGLAHELVGNMSGGDRTMLITFGGNPRVVQPFTSEKALLDSAIRTIRKTDANSKIREALAVAKGVRKAAEAVAGQGKAGVVTTIISDGGVGFLGNLVTEDDEVEFLPVGVGDDNQGIVAFELRESFEKRGEAQVFVSVENFSVEPADIKLRCLIGDVVVQVKEATIEAGESQGFVFTGLDASAKEMLRLELAGDDMLPSDDVVHGWLDLQSEMRILIVTTGNYILERFAPLLPGAAVDKVAPADYEPISDYDVIIFDQFAPPDLGPGHYLFLNAVPPLEGFKAAEEPIQNQEIIDWHRVHPIMRFLNFDQTVFGEALDLTVADWMVTLAESARAPLILAGEDKGIKLICLAFDIFTSDWPLQIGFPVFFSNALEWLALEGRSNAADVHLTGDTIVLQSDQEIEITGPDEERYTIRPDENNLAYFGQTFRAGVYRTRYGDEEEGSFAVNLLSPAESDITPQDALLSGEQRIAASSLGRENREIWKWFAFAALIVLTGEWHLYARRSWL